MGDFHNEFFDQNEEAVLESKKNRMTTEERITALTARKERLSKSLERTIEISNFLCDIESKAEDFFNSFEDTVRPSPRGYGYTAYEVQNKISELLSATRMEKLYARNRTKHLAFDIEEVTNKINSLTS